MHLSANLLLGFAALLLQVNSTEGVAVDLASECREDNKAVCVWKATDCPSQIDHVGLYFGELCSFGLNGDYCLKQRIESDKCLEMHQRASAGQQIQIIDRVIHEIGGNVPANITSVVLTQSAILSLSGLRFANNSVLETFIITQPSFVLPNAVGSSEHSETIAESNLLLSEIKVPASTKTIKVTALPPTPIMTVSKLKNLRAKNMKVETLFPIEKKKTLLAAASFTALAAAAPEDAASAGSVAVAGADDMCSSRMLNQIGFRGADLFSVPKSSPAECCAACTGDCLMFTWWNGQCYMKNTAGGGLTVEFNQPQGVISGFRPNTYLFNLDLYGSDYTQMPTPTTFDCVAQCWVEANCKAASWTSYNGGTCFMKTGFTGHSIVPKQGVTSMVFVH